MTQDDDTPKAGTAAPTTVGARDDGPRKPAGPAPKDERRETQERLAEAMGGQEQRKAREALKEDPGLQDPGQPAPGKSGAKKRPRRGQGTPASRHPRDSGARPHAAPRNPQSPQPHPTDNHTEQPQAP